MRIKYIIVLEPFAERLPINHGGGGEIKEVEAARNLPAIAGGKVAITIAVGVGGALLLNR